MVGTTANRLTTGSVGELASLPQAAASPLRYAALMHQSQELKEALERSVTFERRQYARISLPMVLRVTPLDESGQPQDELATTVVGKDISPRGIGFFHEKPLVYRRVIVSLENPEVGRFSMEVDLGWCRFTRPGWYESGGRLIRVVDSQPVGAS